MSSGSHNLVLFLGRFHPVLVHLPIGGLVLLGVLELLAKFSRFKDAAQNNRLILGVTAAASVAAALLGWLLSQSGDYDPQLLQWHKWTGFAVAATCTVTFLLSRPDRGRAYYLSLLAALAVLAVASHLGASITHGRDFLFHYAPGPLRSLFREGAGAPAARSASSGPLPQRVFAAVVQPMLLQRCADCHGPEKQKGDLRVDSLAALLKGGKDGPVLVPGNAKDSRLIQRLLLPPNDDDHMPPEGKPQPTPAEITLLEWWIDSGGPADGSSGGEARP
jgi:uncharacterized membrane protein/mono/diheme cytochrome c family protein